jgi:transcriptional regulator with XRE-family HTH domain
MTLTELVERRVNKGLSLDAAAREIGISRNTLEKAELGGDVRLDVKKKIASYYRVRVTTIWPISEREAA